MYEFHFISFCSNFIFHFDIFRNVIAIKYAVYVSYKLKMNPGMKALQMPYYILFEI